jgi:D-xylose transport system substrate-binding protein
VAVTKDNIKDTVLADNFVSRDDLCAGKFADACEKAGI